MKIYTKENLDKKRIAWVVANRHREAITYNLKTDKEFIKCSKCKSMLNVKYLKERKVSINCPICDNNIIDRKQKNAILKAEAENRRLYQEYVDFEQKYERAIKRRK